MKVNEFIFEGKKSKKKIKSAVYGPGQYGMYGTNVGYSGDGGSVGEARLDKPTFSLQSLAKKHNVDYRYLLNQLHQGIKVELEHTTDPKTAKEIALDHISERPDYYEKLKELEGIEEGWKDWVAGAALGAGVAMSNPAAANVERVYVSPGDTVYSIAKAFGTTPQVIQKLNKLDKNFSVKAGQEIKVPAGEVVDVIDQPSKQNNTATKAPEIKKPEVKQPARPNIEITKADLENSVTGRKLEVFFRKYAESQGIKGAELAHLMAQADVETDHFKTLKEYGNNAYFKMYEPVFKKDKNGRIIIDPKTKKPKHFREKADDLGNDYRGDGARYKGRGFLQVTGRYNYRTVGQRIGVDLEKNPEILEKDPYIAAKASLAYWEIFVKPNIKNFKNVRDVTGEINPGLKHLQKRKDRHQEYKVALR